MPLSQPFRVRIPVVDRKTLEVLATETKQSKSAIVAQAIRNFIKNQQNEEPSKAA